MITALSELTDLCKQVEREKSEQAHLSVLLAEIPQVCGKINDLEQSYLDLLSLVSSIMDTHEAYLSGHSERVAMLSCDTARQLGLTDKEIEDLHWAGLLHDIGETIIPAYILHKPSELTAEEWDIITGHPVAGAEIVGKLKKFKDTATIIRAHHERFDGNGYPQGLKGDEIPIGARVLSVADTYDAITNFRLHREHRNHIEAIDEINQCSGINFDPQVVDAFTSMF